MTSSGTISPQLCSPTSSISSSQILSGVTLSPSETPKHSQVFYATGEKEGDLSANVSNAATSMSTASYMTSIPTTVPFQQPQPMQHVMAPASLAMEQQHQLLHSPPTSLVLTAQTTQSILSNYMKSSAPQYMPSVVYNLPSDLESLYQQQNSESVTGGTSEHSTLTLSTLSIPSKVSVLSAGGGGGAGTGGSGGVAMPIGTIHQVTPAKAATDTMPFTTTSGQFSSLTETKFQTQSLLDKVRTVT